MKRNEMDICSFKRYTISISIPQPYSMVILHKSVNVYERLVFVVLRSFWADDFDVL